jgi:hypothetical protein
MVQASSDDSEMMIAAFDHRFAKMLTIIAINGGQASKSVALTGPNVPTQVQAFCQVALMSREILNYSLGDGVCYDMMTAGIQVGVVHGVVQGLARDLTRLSQCLIQIDRDHT